MKKVTKAKTIAMFLKDNKPTLKQFKEKFPTYMAAAPILKELGHILPSPKRENKKKQRVSAEMAAHFVILKNHIKETGTLPSARELGNKINKSHAWGHVVLKKAKEQGLFKVSV